MRLTPPIVVFVRPQAAGNIGALSRVMSNFGVTELRLVGAEPQPHAGNPNDPFLSMDWALAKRGDRIREGARWFADLGAALHGTDIAIGTSGRDVEFDLGYARPLVLPEQGLAAVAAAQQRVEKPDFKWALVMGPEDDGLSDHEGALCQKLIRIPTSDMNTSMNIAMAAGVLLYHWHLFARGATELPAAEASGPFMPPDKKNLLKSSEAGREEFANFEQKEAFLNYLIETVAKTSFFKYPDHEAVAARVRRWLQMGMIPVGELLFAFEIIYHLRAWGSGTFEKRDFLKKPKD